MRSKIIQSKCFWCGEVNKNIYYFFKNPNTEKQKIQYIYNSYIPCNYCNKYMKKGIIVFEVKKTSDETFPQFSRLKGFSPTSRWFILNRKNYHEMPNTVKKRYKTIIDKNNREILYLYKKDFEALLSFSKSKLGRVK